MDINTLSSWLSKLNSQHYAWFDVPEGVSELVLFSDDRRNVSENTISLPVNSSVVQIYKQVGSSIIRVVDAEFKFLRYVERNKIVSESITDDEGPSLLSDA